MLNKLKCLVHRLEQLEQRANKYRDKAGRIEVGVDEYNELVSSSGATPAEAPVELTIADYVRRIDEYIESVVGKLFVEDK
jgi:hypothetical protein